MQTKTRVGVSTKTIIATAVILAAGGAAYAATTLTNIGYRTFEASCYDGSYISDDGHLTKMSVGGQTYVAPSSGCQSSATWNSQAQGFCSFRPAGPRGKRGVNSFSVSNRCRIPQNPGTIYGYGYNSIVTTTLQQPSGISQLRKGKYAPGVEKPY